MSTRPTKSEISIWRDFFGSADSSSSSVRMTYSPPPRSNPARSGPRDLLTGPLVDLLVADPVGRPLLELVEVDALVRRGRIQADGDVHQSETESPLPYRAWHAHQNTSPEQVHHLVTAFRHTEAMVKDAPAGFGPALLGGLAELGPVEPFSGDLSLELGISVWLRTSGTSLLQARSVAPGDPAGDPGGLRPGPGHRADPHGRAVPAIRRRSTWSPTSRTCSGGRRPGLGAAWTRSSRPWWRSCRHPEDEALGA